MDSQKSKTQLALSINQYFSEVNYSEEPMKIPGEVGFGNLGGSKAFNWELRSMHIQSPVPYKTMRLDNQFTGS